MIKEIEQAGYVRGQVEGLIHELGGSTHAVLRLEQGARQVIQDCGLIEKAKAFLIDTITDDKLQITLHISNNDEELHYLEILLGPVDTLRGLQCQSISDQEVMLSFKQNYNSNSRPSSPDSCRALNDHLNKDCGAAFDITKGVLEITADLLEKRPSGLRLAQLL